MVKTAIAVSIARDRDPALAFVADQVTRATLTRVAARHGWGEGTVRAGGVVEATQALAGMTTPALVIVDLSDEDQPDRALAAMAEVCDPGTEVIALGTVNDVGLFRRLSALGARDYLVKPISAEDIDAAVDAALAVGVAAPTKTDPGRLIAIVGARGGAGATTVAVNCAAHMAHALGMKVALVDLDVAFGTVALALDVDPGLGFRGALENPGRIDGLFIERAMVRQGDNLFVLAAEDSLEAPLTPDPDAIGILVDRLRRDFGRVVIDLPRNHPQLGIVLAAAETVVMVADLTLAATRDTSRLIERVRAIAPQARLRVAVNRAGAAGRGEMARADFERFAGHAIDHLIPFDSVAVATGLGRGRALVQAASRSRAAVALRRLAGDVAGRETATRPAWWRRLLSGAA